MGWGRTRWVLQLFDEIMLQIVLQMAGRELP